MHPHIAFSLPLAASNEQVGEVIDSIREFFNVSGSATSATTNVTNTVAPSTIAASTAGLELDSTGMPYDERIHAKTKTKTGAGVWTRRRNISDTLVAQVEAERRAQVGGTVTAAPAAAPAAPTTPLATPTAPAAPAAPAPLATPAAPVAPAPLAAPAAPTLTPFQQLAVLISKHTQSPENPAGKLNEAWIKSVLEFYDVPNGALPELAHLPDKVEIVRAFIVKALKDSGLSDAEI